MVIMTKRKRKEKKDKKEKIIRELKKDLGRIDESS
jgi:hypothetical protein